MRALLFAILCCASASAQISFSINTGNNQLQTLTSPYQFPDTPVSSTSSLTIRVVNSSTAPVTIGAIYVGESANSSVPNSNFTITGWDQNATLASQGGWKEFTLDFAPLASGSTTGYLQAVVNTAITTVSTLQGTGTPGLELTCSGSPAQCNGNSFNNSAPLNFGNVPSGAVSSITFTFANQTSGTLDTPSVSLETQLYVTSAFTLDISSLPATISANSTATFKLTFAPAQPGTLFSANLLVGSSTYQVEGAAPTSLGGLEISYVYQTIRYTPASNSIDFGQINGSATLAFTVTNPIAATSAATVSVSVSGAAFSLSGAPASPDTLQPGQSLMFQLSFSGSQAGSFTGTLTIGTQVFTLTATVPSAIGGPGSALPGIHLVCGASPCTGQSFSSQQQVNLSVELDSPAPSQSIFTLAISFAPAVSGVSDDSAVAFIAPVSGRNLQMTMPSGGETAAYNGQSQLTFQTGTTAGTITFTLTFLQQTAKWSITIPPAQVQITSALAQRQSPNLVITINGYDNTYSVGQLSFAFYDTSGRVLGSSPLQASVVASDFHQYFFGPNDAAGGFSVQVTFPVLIGDVTNVGSVAVSVTNSQGTTAPVTQAFQ